MLHLGEGDNAMENGKPRRKRLTIFRDFVFFLIIALLTLDICGYFKSRLEAKWYVEWAQLVGQGKIENTFLCLIKDREGTLFETVSVASFIAMVDSCSSNRVNNVWYVGSTNGFDYFIHNSDFQTQRIRVHSCNLKETYRMPKTDEVTRWLTVSEPPSGAAELTSFLNGGQLKHPPKRPY